MEASRPADVSHYLGIFRRHWWIALIATGAGLGAGVALTKALPKTYESARAAVRRMAQDAGAGFVLVHVNTPLEVCEQRDRKGLYARARAGQLRGMTGIDDPYEEPANAELTIDTTTITVPEAIELVLAYLVENGWVEPKLT